MTSRRRAPFLTAAIAATTLVIASLSGCAAVPTAPVLIPVTIGSLDFIESEIAAQVYGQYLAANGYDVRYNTGVGQREDLVPALQEPFVDLIADYSADLLYSLNPDATATSATTVTDSLALELSRLQLRALDATPAERTDAFVVTRAFAEAHSVASIADLATLPESFSLSANVMFDLLSYGKEGMLDTYELDGWRFVPAGDDSDGALSTVLLEGGADVIVIPENSPLIAAHDLVVLDDPERLLPDQNLIPIVHTQSRSVRMSTFVNDVSTRLTTAELDGLVARAAEGTTTPATIVREWLATTDLVTS